MERVQKVLSQWGIASRRQAEKMIEAGRVKVNGSVAVLGDKVDLNRDKLEVDGRQVRSCERPSLVYLLINKPKAVVSTCSDPQKRATALDLLPHQLKDGQGIHPVGRLDYNSTGALILTNDGNLTLNLTHPRYHLPKTYLVWLDGVPTPKDLQRWRKGIQLEGRLTMPAKVKIVHRQLENKTCLEIVLTEGRNRQIRKVAKLLGFKVVSLHRTAIGTITLQTAKGQLASGEYRHLTKKEINYLKQHCSKFASHKDALHK